MEYTTVERILGKLHRDLKGSQLHEADAIEWIGEALDFMRVPGNLEEVVTFVPVKDYHADVPCGLHMVLQIARDRSCGVEAVEAHPCDCHVQEEPVIAIDSGCGCGGSAPSFCEDDPALQYFKLPCGCHDEIEVDDGCDVRPMRPRKCPYEWFAHHKAMRERFTPVRLSNHTFFNSIVCKERGHDEIYKHCVDEYTIVGTVRKRFRFSFPDGLVGVSYLRQAIDDQTGYPLVPDNPSVTEALVYYVKWKLAERYQWVGMQGYTQIAERANLQWLKYVRQAKAYFKMPKSVDDYQDLLEQSHHLIPRMRRYYGYFGQLGKEEDQSFKQRIQ